MITFGTLFSLVGGWRGAGMFVVGVAAGWYATDLWFAGKEADRLRAELRQAEMIIEQNKENFEQELADKDRQIEQLALAAQREAEQADQLQQLLEELSNAPQEDDRVLSDTSQHFFDRLRNTDDAN